MDVFNYSDYRVLLRDYYAEQKQKHTSFSYRVFANRAKLASPNYLKLVIEGSRRITDRNISQFVRGLKLNGWEAEYFKRLVEFQNATDPELQRHYLGELDSIKLKATRQMTLPSVSQLEILKSWRHLAVRELVLLDDFKNDPNWMASRLKFDVTPEQAAESFKLLLDLKFIGLENGRYVQRDAVMHAGGESYSKLLVDFYRQSFDLASRSLDERIPETRENGSVSLAVSKQSVQDIRRDVRRFIKEINRVYSKDTGNDEVYHLVINFFPLTQQGRGVLQ